MTLVKSIAVLVVLLAAVGYFTIRARRLYRMLRLGPNENRFDNIPERIRGVLSYVGLHTRMFRNLYSGTLHFFIFYGFVVLLTAIVQAFGEGIFPGFSLAVIGGASLSAALLRRYRPQLVVALGLTGIAAADLALIPSAGAPLAVAACAAVAGAGIGVSSVATTGLGTDVETYWRGSASGIINTASQLGTAIGIAVLLLIAAATTGTPAPGIPAPAIAWAVAAAVAAAGAVFFATASQCSRSPMTSGSVGGRRP